jgi:uncharacterized membrane protein YqaE (UPF0057 family)
MNVQLLVLSLYLPFFGVEPATFGELNVYNSCFIHIRKFSNNIASADLTSLLVKGQFSSRKFALFSIFNGTHRKPQIQPVGSINEKCTLNVIVDFQPNDYKRLLYFMNVNKYTFISKPHSFYVLVVKANSVKIHPSTVIFPTSIFILKVSDIFNNRLVPIYKSVFLFFCSACEKHIHSIQLGADTQTLNDLHYQTKWSFPQQHVQAVIEDVVGDINGCEKVIWQRWLASYIQRKYHSPAGCSKSFAFYDLLTQTVQKNLTLSFEVDLNPLEDGYTVFVTESMWNKHAFLNPSFSSSGYFHLFALAKILYCDCDGLSESSFVRKWVNCLPTNLWYTLIALTLLTFTFNILESGIETGTFGCKAICTLLLELVGIVLRQGSAARSISILILCLTAFIISSVYENGLTSELIVPLKKSKLELNQLINSG